jgi:thiosulfate/3-mercaptopyruvate sulfurtransferase
MAYTTLIPATALLRALSTEDWVVLDCRFDLADPQAGRRAFEQGHIPGARHADLNHELSAPVGTLTGRHPLPDPDEFARTAGSWGISPGTQVIVYDDNNGSFAARAWWMLRWIGVPDVAVLDGGWAAWRAAGGAVETTLASARAAKTLRAEVQPDWVLSAAGVAAALSAPGSMLVDARAAARFAGELEPIDPVAGHIPGARNHPFTLNLQPDGRLRPAAELRRHWQAFLGATPPSRLISMCGSGVTACHNLLALEVAQLPGAALYAGSWSEWIRDPARPVARGA